MTRIAAFRTLHASGCFVIPNPWDAGSARVLAALGFPALATTSSGIAWSLGQRDNHIALNDALARIRAIAAAVDVPVNADFEGGFAIEPSAVAANVGLAVATGVAGLSIEDSTGDASNPLFDFQLAVERVRAARQAIDASGTGVLLFGRIHRRSSRSRGDDSEADRLCRSRRGVPLRSRDSHHAGHRRRRHRGSAEGGQRSGQ
jgi:2-methylisocitrate lyase-like PEP mutase family enzyme